MHFKRTEHSYLTTKRTYSTPAIQLANLVHLLPISSDDKFNDSFKKGVIMKSITMPENEQLNDEMNEQLINDAKENLAKDAIVKNNKTKFTAVDMWNAQRNASSASSRIRRWNLN